MELAKHNIDPIIIKLINASRFGIFAEGKDCYFEDGEKISYTDLWAAVRSIHNLPVTHNKTLAELCPKTFEGNYRYKFSRHKWKKQYIP
jgi:hypothetical protein